VWLGAILTAALFEVGKFLIGLYIGKQGLGSIYGPAASIVVVLIWVYYSAQLVLMGAEFTNVYARRYGSQKNAASTDRRPAEDKRVQHFGQVENFAGMKVAPDAATPGGTTLLLRYFRVLGVLQAASSPPCCFSFSFSCLVIFSCSVSSKLCLALAASGR
jgi:membrane protein